MTKQHKLDIDLGEALRSAVIGAAQATGMPPTAYARDLIRRGLEADRLFAGVVTEAVLALAQAVEPDERYDPVDDDRRSEAAGRLAALLGSQPAADGIASALAALWADRQLPAPRGLELDEATLGWLDELVAQAQRPHTRETLLAELIGNAWRTRQGGAS